MLSVNQGKHVCVLLAHSRLPTLYSDDHKQIWSLVLASYAPAEDLYGNQNNLNMLQVT